VGHDQQRGLQNGAKRGGLVGKLARPVIDWMFSKFGDERHCFRSYISAKYNLPTKDF